MVPGEVASEHAVSAMRANAPRRSYLSSEQISVGPAKLHIRETTARTLYVEAPGLMMIRSVQRVQTTIDKGRPCNPRNISHKTRRAAIADDVRASDAISIGWTREPDLYTCAVARVREFVPIYALFPSIHSAALARIIRNECDGVSDDVVYVIRVLRVRRWNRNTRDGTKDVHVSRERSER